MKNEKRVKIRKQEVLIITVLFAIFALSVCVGYVSAATYTVCPSGCDYTRIQAAIEAADLCDTIKVHSGTYYEHVNVNKQLILKGVDTGSGKPVVDASGSDSAITLSAGGITLDGFTATNSGSSREDADAGIRVTSNNNIITGNNVSNNNGSGIYLNSCGNNITGNTFVNDGLFVTNNSYQNTVKSNIVNGKPLVYLEEASGMGVTDAGQVILVNCNNITVDNLDLSDASVGVELLGTEDSIISNNTLSNNRVGICLGYSCNNNNITGNTASNNLIHGIVLENSSNSNNIIGNSANNNYGGGIVLMDSCNNNNITGNTASYNWAGIVLGYSCNNNNIIGNNASYNNCGGIVLGYSCNSNNIIGNNASYNNCNGIEFTDSNNNNITCNNVSYNNDYGISLNSSSNNAITGNNVGYNNYGIYLWSSSNNKIYLNKFINNTNNVYSFNSTNIWNSTEEMAYTYNGSTYTNYLGNYWSDYKEKYPEAEEINGYGIWDMPYSIDSDNDTYPLIQPGDNYFAPAASIFDTDSGTYPSIMGTHTGTITPSRSINVSKLYTYSCAGTGGHTESIKLEENGTLIANGTWDGYLGEDWQNITLHNVTDGTHYVTLLQDHEYNYTIRTGSYPQILHAASKEVTGGTITCTSFVDANGKTYTDVIPAIKFF